MFRLVIGILASFEVAQHHPVGRLGDEILRRFRDLPSAAGRIDAEGGNGQARGVPPQVLDDLDTRRHRRAEMLDPLRKVALVDVVRTDPDFKQPLDQLFISSGQSFTPRSSTVWFPEDARIGQAGAGPPRRGDFLGWLNGCSNRWDGNSPASGRARVIRCGSTTGAGPSG